MNIRKGWRNFREILVYKIAFIFAEKDDPNTNPEDGFRRMEVGGSGDTNGKDEPTYAEVNWWSLTSLQPIHSKPIGVIIVFKVMYFTIANPTLALYNSTRWGSK